MPPPILWPRSWVSFNPTRKQLVVQGFPCLFLYVWDVLATLRHLPKGLDGLEESRLRPAAENGYGLISVADNEELLVALRILACWLAALPKLSLYHLFVLYFLGVQAQRLHGRYER
jgi:hypothetical protein